MTRTGLADSLSHDFSEATEYSAAVDFYQGPAPANQCLKKKYTIFDLFAKNIAKPKLMVMQLSGSNSYLWDPQKMEDLFRFFVFAYAIELVEGNGQTKSLTRWKSKNAQDSKRKIYSDEQKLR